MQLALVFFCLLVGFLIKKYKKLPENPQHSINAWVLYVALPATTLRYIPEIVFNKNLLLPLLSPPILFFSAWLVLLFIHKQISPLKNATFGAILLITGLGNTSFIGFPLTKAYFGLEGFKIAVLFDQANYAIMSSLGVFSAIVYGSRNKQLNIRNILIEIVTFPTFIAFFVSVTLYRPLHLDGFKPLFEALSATMIPLALFSIGLQLNFKQLFDSSSNLFYALGFKLFLSPLIVIGLGFLLKTNGLEYSVSVFEAAMPTMATTSIIASEYGLNTKLTNQVLSIGIVLSLFTTFVLQYLLLH